MSASSLHLLSKEGDLKTLQLALKSQDPNVKDSDGMRPLHYAAWYGHPSVCQALVNAGADVNAFDNDGATPLHAAAYNGQLNTLVVLIELGADSTITDNDNATAAQVASEEGKVEASAFLSVVEEDQRTDKELARLEEAITAAKDKAKTCKSRMSKMLKETKKLIVAQEKEAKKIAKATLKNKKRKSRGAVPQAGPVDDSKPLSFSQMAGTSNQDPNDSSSAVEAKPPRLSSRRTSQHSLEADRSSRMFDMEILLAEIGADRDDSEALALFLKHLDLQEFARLFEHENINLDSLRKMSAKDLQKMGLPPIAVKKISSAFHQS